MPLSARVIETPSASTRMLITSLLTIVSPLVCGRARACQCAALIERKTVQPARFVVEPGDVVAEMPPLDGAARLDQAQT
jgi:hypothetical protein